MGLLLLQWCGTNLYPSISSTFTPRTWCNHAIDLIMCTSAHIPGYFQSLYFRSSSAVERW